MSQIFRSPDDLDPYWGKVKIPFYRRLMPWLPVWLKYKELNMFMFKFINIRTKAVSITKLHRFDLLFPINRKWYHPPVGFQLWL